MEIVFASPSLGPIPALAIIRDAPFVFAGGGVRPEARRRGAGSLLLREICSLMHNLDKSMLILAAHTESADAFLIKVGALPKPQPCQAELSSRNSTGLYSRNGKSAPRLAALNGNATPAASRARRSWHFCATFSALFADAPLGDQIVEVAFFVGHGDQPPVAVSWWHFDSKDRGGLVFCSTCREGH
jgi:hypothetical protein